MLGDKRGFTLAEIITSLMILGVVAAAVIPVFLEWRREQHLLDQRFEAMFLLQERMERLQREAAPLQTRGKEKYRGKAAEGTVYRIAWKKGMQKRLVRTEVIVEWKDAQGNDKELRLKGLQFVP